MLDVLSKAAPMEHVTGLLRGATSLIWCLKSYKLRTHERISISSQWFRLVCENQIILHLCMMGRPTPHRKQSNTRPEPQRHNSGNTASFAAGIIAGAVAAHMSHRYKGNDDDEEIEYDLRGQKQVTFEDDYRRQPYNSYGSGTNLKSCFRKPNSMHTHSRRHA